MNATRTLADGRFSITRRLGEGGMAEVWEAYDHTLDVWRAIKFLHPNLASRKGIVRRFKDEAHAMARLEHPNVVRVYDVGEDDEGNPYMVMELANGGSIERYLNQHGAMAPTLAVSVIREVCEGVQAAHDAGIIHRDLKPDNLLVDRRGRTKVTDFGIAQLQETTSRTRTGSVMGTLAFMAPEQRSDSKHVGPQADVYALAATLVSMLTNEVPTELFMAQHHDGMLAGIPDHLRPPLLDALRYDTAARTPSAAAFAAALGAIPLATPTSPPPPLLAGAIEDRPVPSQSRPPVSDLGDVTLLPEEVEQARNAPDTLEPDQVAALLPSLIGELQADLESDSAAHAAAQRKADALARLTAIRERTETTPLSIPTVDSPPIERSVTAPTAVADDVATSTATPPVAPQQDQKVKGTSDGSPLDGVVAAFDLFMKLVMGPLKPLGVVAFLAVVPFTLFTGQTVSQINRSAEAASKARDALLGTLEAEKAVLNDVDFIGGDSSQGRLHLARLSGMEGEAKLEAAATYVSSVAGQVYSNVQNPPPGTEAKADAARERLQRLEYALTQYETAMANWTAAASSTSGVGVCGSGLANCP